MDRCCGHDWPVVLVTRCCRRGSCEGHRSGLRSAFGAGANWGVRRTGLDAVGGFDERLGPATWFAAAEDADLYDRLVLAGYVGRYCPDVRVDRKFGGEVNARR